MGQVLRITVGSADYSFKLLDWSETALTVELDGKTYRLERQGRSWISSDENAELGPQLAEAVGKAIALRYRI